MLAIGKQSLFPRPFTLWLEDERIDMRDELRTADELRAAGCLIDRLSEAPGLVNERSYTVKAKHWQSSHENHQTIDIVHRMSFLQHAPACLSLHSDGRRGGVICGVACCQTSSEELDGRLESEQAWRTCSAVYEAQSRPL